MSYDFSIKTKNGNTISESIDNYTYNVSEIFSRSLGVESITKLSGRQNRILIEIFDKAILDIKNNWDEYKKMEPENEWGTLEGAVQILNFYSVWFRKEPEFFFHVD